MKDKYSGELEVELQSQAANVKIVLGIEDAKQR